MRASAASVTATAVVAPARTAVAIVAASARVRSRLLAGTPAPVGLVEQRKFHDQRRHLREALEMAITPGWCAGSIGKPVNAAAGVDIGFRIGGLVSHTHFLRDPVALPCRAWPIINASSASRELDHPKPCCEAAPPVVPPVRRFPHVFWRLYRRCSGRTGEF
jgi:hypothetical protein